MKLPGSGVSRATTWRKRASTGIRRLVSGNAEGACASAGLSAAQEARPVYWPESYSEKEVPPENIWEDAEGLEQWWKAVEEAKKDGTTVGDDEDEDDPRMLQNELTREL